ncbi:MAG: hypothetical protein Q8N08_02005 [Methanobacteriaceae archaeon]|nr:hypothetical protein [Methanobacteriaceae archaeon]
MQVQPGIYIKFVFTGANLANAIGKAVAFSTDEGEVRLATDDDVGFAGIIQAVDAGKSLAVEGDNVNVCNEGVLEVIADGAVLYGDTVALGTDGTVKAIPADATQSVANIKLTIGRALEDASNGEVFKALIHAK